MTRIRSPPTPVGASRRCVAGALALLLGSVLLASSSPTAAASGPSLMILAPAENAVIGNGSPVVVLFNVSGFDLVQPGQVGQVSSPTQGYANLSVDGTPARLITRVEPVSLPLPSGPHTIEMRLFASNMTPLSPDVSATVHVTVTQGPVGGTPSLRIVTPVEAQVTGHDVYVYVAVSNFAIVSPYGQPNAPNEGHVQLLRDGIFQQDLGLSAFGFIVDMHDGNNTITARLVTNDDTPLSPGVSANVTIYVKLAADPAPAELFTGGISLVLAAILVVLLYRRRKTVRLFETKQAPKP